MSRYEQLEALYGQPLMNQLYESKVLMVGSGGIGCELIKNLVLSGFKDITVIDLDTIEVSNLNRQFLFRKKHVGRSKCEVARESVLEFNPDVKIQALHGNVKDEKFDVTFFQQFRLVLNGLDNLDARRHVNGMCLVANVPLIESGTQGYLGQVSMIKHGLSECFECRPHPTAKTYAICTIRTTPDKPVHCIVWANHLYQLLFGPKEDDNVLSDLKTGTDLSDAEAVLTHFFTSEITKVIETQSWSERAPPVALQVAGLKLEATQQAALRKGRISTDVLLSTGEYGVQFIAAIEEIYSVHQDQIGSLTFDKDDDLAMKFVSAAANLRMACYGIQCQSEFTIKGIAGNIVHAIATTNAIAAGLIVLEAFKVFEERWSDGRTTWVSAAPPALLVAQKLSPPNKQCYVCGDMLTVEVDTTVFTLKQLYEDVLRTQLGFQDASLDVSNQDNYIGSQEDVLDDHGDTALALPVADPRLKMANGAVVVVDDDRDDNMTLNVKLLFVHVEGATGVTVKGQVPAPRAKPVPVETKVETPVRDTTVIDLLADSPPPASSDSTSSKRKSPDSENSNVETIDVKKFKVNA